MALFTVTKLVRETNEVPVDGSKAGPSIGSYIDDMIAEAVASHQEVNSISFEITPDEWSRIQLAVGPAEAVGEEYAGETVSGFPARSKLKTKSGKASPFALSKGF